MGALPCCNNLRVFVCVSLPVSRKADDQQIGSFLPIAYMYQMFAEQEGRTEGQEMGIKVSDGTVKRELL